ncbi:ATP-dependent DNA helicase RecG [Coriobacteriia bacterium Es71-Z0120]|uniref:ATP-dependent DNA helicase RecG n=1 Tax=Parvivirga hydrogeniphila TaxID=2939460 RepID=UPI002260C390|nr:ATP-dependent DNA helicase RecG [Parvivirga hydrogeniphila]MCL4079551.1 ATP-dependent DNA helicase RecG [Parvivirga hydrogeniphila]
MPEALVSRITASDPRCAETWDSPVTVVRNVDARRAEALGRLGIHTIGDLLTHYPFRYLDLSAVRPVREAPLGSEATIVGTVADVRVKQPRPRLSVTEIAVADDTGVVVGVWFNQPYIAQRYEVGDRVAMAGTMELDYGLKQMKNPFLERLGAAGTPVVLGRILPVYRTTEGLSTNWLRRIVESAVLEFAHVPDPLPSGLRARRDLPPLKWAVRAIHLPRSSEDIEVARRRLAYQEHFDLQLVVATRRHARLASTTAVAHTVDGARVEALRRALPFPLTDDQERAVSEILADMAAARPMNRLLLGDVGSGKTVVAAFALAAAADTHAQAAMMAPTEVLAEQYTRALGPLLEKAGVPWALLTGSTPRAERSRILAQAASGELAVVFGTHALIQRDVRFSRLTLVVVDEQHRFGVEQRLGLRGKGGAVTPDLLVMTATPIPRSLALTLYGDLDASYLTTRPGSRGPGHVVTRIVPRTGRADAYERVRSAVRAGRQAYVICALVEESDSAEARAATREAHRLQTSVFPDLRVGLLTGRMRPAEKRAVMEDFRAGKIDVLVSTTVVEVGVDVPNATVMIVENGERYGLAQLHQLRGRIGRGEHPGEFLVFADPRTEEGRRRMQAIAETSDGFALAEADLRLRGEGDIAGVRQSGLPPFKIASFAGQEDLLALAREDARASVDADPTLASPEHALLRARLRALQTGRTVVDSG